MVTELQSKELGSYTPILHNLQKEKSDTPLHVHLKSGNSDSQFIVTRLISLIKKRLNTEIKSAKVVINNSGSLAIDSRNGQIFTVFDPAQLSQPKELMDIIHNNANLEKLMSIVNDTLLKENAHLFQIEILECYDFRDLI